MASELETSRFCVFSTLANMYKEIANMHKK